MSNTILIRFIPYSAIPSFSPPMSARHKILVTTLEKNRWNKDVILDIEVNSHVWTVCEQVIFLALPACKHRYLYRPAVWSWWPHCQTWRRECGQQLDQYSAVSSVQTSKNLEDNVIMTINSYENISPKVIKCRKYELVIAMHTKSKTLHLQMTVMQYHRFMCNEVIVPLYKWRGKK